jgi:hypothetical protein
VSDSVARVPLLGYRKSLLSVYDGGRDIYLYQRHSFSRAFSRLLKVNNVGRIAGPQTSELEVLFSNEYGIDLLTGGIEGKKEKRCDGEEMFHSGDDDVLGDKIPQVIILIGRRDVWRMAALTG